MNENELQKKRKELESTLERMEQLHCKKYNMSNASESAYRASCQANRKVYEELFEVCQQLKDPIPVWI